MRDSIFDSGIKFDKSNIQHLYAMVSGRVMASQIALGKMVIKDNDFNLDLRTGILSFGENSFPAQYIGGESSQSNTWHWGWENINNVSNDLLIMTNAMKSFGEQLEIQEFITANLNLQNDQLGHIFSTITCGLSNINLCYYRIPHSTGALYVTFNNVPKEVFEPVDFLTFSKIVLDNSPNHVFGYDESIEKNISLFTNQTIFIEGFLYANGTDYKWEDNSIVAEFEKPARINFEPDNGVLRLSNMEFEY